MMRTRVFVAAMLASLVLMVVFAGPASAIIDGQKDVGNAYSNVGMLAVRYVDASGNVSYNHGTCTLVGDGVVVTAGHNFDEEDPLDQVRISFAADAKETDWGGAGFYRIRDWVVIPGYESDSLAGIKDDSKRFLRRDDVAVAWLDGSPDIPPAKVVGTTNWLDTLDLKSSYFTVVGYGTTGFVSGSVASWYGRNPNTQMPFDGRHFKTVQAINNSEVYADRYLKTTTGTSFGDSGGPLFFDKTIVGVTVWGESLRCESPAYEFRLDCPAAQEFLHDWLPPSSFATP